MNIDKDGKLDMFGKKTIRVLEEFGWNVEELADMVVELRYEIEAKDITINKLLEELAKASEMSGEQ